MGQSTYYYTGRKVVRSVQIIETIVKENGYDVVDVYDEFLIDIYLLLDASDSKYIAIDWDSTISNDQGLYKKIIKACIDKGYTPFICTLRASDTENIDEIRAFLENIDRDIDIYLTNGKSKRKYMKKKGVKVHLWVDDFYPSIAPCYSKLFKRNNIDY